MPEKTKKIETLPPNGSKIGLEQLENYSTNHPLLLTVCNKGLSRSPALTEVLHEYAVGSSSEVQVFALKDGIQGLLNAVHSGSITKEKVAQTLGKAGLIISVGTIGSLALTAKVGSLKAAERVSLVKSIFDLIPTSKLKEEETISGQDEAGFEFIDKSK